MEYNTLLIGRRIKAARHAKGYTQDYVSAHANIGVKFLSQIECGKAGLSVPTLLALCDILGVTPNYLLLGSPDAALREGPLERAMQGLSQQQLHDAEALLLLFVKNCK